jgi:predicted AAA+ superfamily ATPase
MVTRKLNLFNILGHNESCILFGPRGTGKTLLCSDFINQLEGPNTVIDLLDRETYQQHLNSPGLFKSIVKTQSSIKQSSPNTLHTYLIDEVQKLPELLDDVHSILEEESRSGLQRSRFILTGSSARKLKRGSANLLAGRAISLKLFPLNISETKISLERALQYGTLPSFYLKDRSPELNLKSYSDTYVREEVYQELLVRNLKGFERFIDLAAQYNGEPINFSKLARLINLTSVTVQSYFEILSDILLTFRLDVWSFSEKIKIASAPKYYFFDCGVLNALRGELNATIKPGSFRYGKLFETFLINQILALNHYDNRDFKPYFWRTQTGSEVDLILARGPGDTPRAIEFKSARDINESDLKGLMAFKREYPNSQLFCLSQSTAEFKIGEILILPWESGIKRVLED